MDSFGIGQQTPFDVADDHNVVAFIVKRYLAQMSTMKVVKVKAVAGGGTAASPGTVDVQPLVNQLDGYGNKVEHGTVYKLPWYRMQGGSGAVVCDPKAGDVGMVICADRDTSAVRTSGGEPANPGSYRKFDLADGVYVGGILNGAPEQFVAFTDDGIVIQDKNGNKIEFKAGSIEVTTAAFRCNGSVVAGFGGPDQVSLQTHNHPTAAPGPASPPTPGS